MKKPQRMQQARQKRRAAKEKARRAEYAERKANAEASQDYPAETFTPELQRFWLAHGVNCLLSDYAQGTWTPLFEGLYEGRIPATVEEIQATVLRKFADRKEWPAEAKAALAWTVSSPKLLYVYWHEAMRRMQRAHPDLEPEEVEPLVRRPADGCVWDLFHYTMSKLLQRKG